MNATDDRIENVRKAIENLMTAKLLDAVARPGGVDRLLAHRSTGVASSDIRNAERELERVLARMLAASARHQERQVRN